MDYSPNLILGVALGLIVLIIIVTYFNTYRKMENFDITNTEFVGLGHPKYDLRGERLNSIYVGDYYVRPDRHIKLNSTRGFEWNANVSPIDQGVPNCKKIVCPKYPDNYDPSNIVYDNIDQCWECGNGCF